MRVAKKFNGNDDSKHLRVKGRVVSLKISRSNEKKKTTRINHAGFMADCCWGLNLEIFARLDIIHI